MKKPRRSMTKRFRIPILVLCVLGILTGIIAGLLWTNHVVASTLVQSRTGTRTSNQANPTLVSATLSPAAVAGHLLVAVVGANGNATITGPAGWSTAINQSGIPSQAIFYTIAVGGETAISASVNASPGSLGIQVYEYVGTEITLAGTASATGTSSTPTSGTIATTDNNELLIAAFTNDGNKRHTNSSWTDPGEGFTERQDFGTTGSGRTAGYASGDSVANSIGTHGVVTAISGSAAWRGQLVAFRTQTTVTNVTSSLANGTYGAGQAVPIQVTFSRAVTVNTSSGTPELNLNNGAHPDYVSGSGSTTLTFTYTIRSGEDIADLDYAATNALTLSGGTILDDANNAALLTLPTPGASGSLGANKNITVHTGTPTFTVQYFSDIALTASLGNQPHLTAGTYYLKITCDEPLDGAPTISIAAEGAANDVTNGATNSISSTVYRYTRVISSDAAAVGAEREEMHITGSDAAGNTSTNAHPENMFSAAAYTDTVAPSTPTLSSISTDNYIRASEKNSIAVAGTAEANSRVSATLSDGSNTITATQQLSGGATSFVLSLDGTAATPAALADGTITPSVTATDAAGNVSTARTTPTATQNSTTPTLTTVTIASNNADTTRAKAGDIITLTFEANEALRTPSVVFNETPVVVSGSGTSWTASRTMSAGDTNGAISFSIAFADLAGNDGAAVATTTNASVVTFDGTPPTLTQITAITSPTRDTTPDYVFSSTEAGTITYGGSCSSATTHAAAGTTTISFSALAQGTYTTCTIRVTDSTGNASGILNIPSFTIDTTAPTITNAFVENADGTYNEGDAVEIHVTFSEQVSVSGSPTINLNSSDRLDEAQYLGNDGTSSLEFLYTIRAGDQSADLDYTDATALALNGASITDVAGNAATLTLPDPGAAHSIGANSAIVIDTTAPDTDAPNVIGVSSTRGNGTYGVGTTIMVHIQFDETLTITGAPQLRLNIGGGRNIPYTSGNGTSTIMFEFVTQSGDDTADLDYVDTTSLVLNGGSITDASGNPAILTLASPGANGSLGRHSDIVIHTIPPVLVELAPIGEYTSDQTPSYTFTSDEDGTITYGGDCTSATVAAIAGTNTIDFNPLAEGYHSNCTITVTDTAGNASNVLAVTAFEIGLSIPQILSVSPVAGSTNQYRLYTVAITFTEPMDPTTFSIADDDTNAYETPNWSNGNATVSIAHAAWTGRTVVTIVIDGNDATGDALSGQKSWSFTTEEAPAGPATGDTPGTPASGATTCRFTPWDRTGWPKGTIIPIGWSMNGDTFENARLLFSLDNRRTWLPIATLAFPKALFVWTMPSSAIIGQTIALRLECLGAGNVLQDTTETSFVVQASSTQRPGIQPTSTFSPDAERKRAPTISDDKDLIATSFKNACSSTKRITGKTNTTIYYCGRDGFRYPFPDAGTYFSWYKTYEGITTVNDEELDAIPIGTTVTYRPGVRLLKLSGNNKIFAVSKGGVLHWITSERTAAAIYGPYWKSKIAILPNEDFENYTIGEPIE